MEVVCPVRISIFHSFLPDKPRSPGPVDQVGTSTILYRELGLSLGSLDPRIGLVVFVRYNGLKGNYWEKGTPL